LVILRINRGATHVKWSPEENKFAVACGAKCVAVCFFEEDQNWWVSKHIKKHRSTVLKVDWHPNNVLLTTAASDFKCRIFSAFIKGVDKGTPETPFGSKLVFGDLFAEIDSALGWVQAARWSPSGKLIGFVGQDSTVCIADISSGTPKVDVVKYKDLPFRDLLFISEDSIVAVGHDCTPVVFSNKNGWSFVKKVDDGTEGSKAASNVKSDAFKVFQNKVDKAQDSTVDSTLNTKHQNAITCVTAYKKNGQNVSQYSTTALDGHLIIWDFK